MNKYKKGFTLLELMIVVAITAILFAIASPLYGRFVAASKVNNLLNEWRSSFYFAQSESLRLKHAIKLCPSEDGTTCANNKDYSKGWIVWDETSSKLLLDKPPILNDKKIIFQAKMDNSYIYTFLANGRLKITGTGGGTALGGGVYASSSKYPSVNKKITVSRAGTLRISKGANTQNSASDVDY